MAGNFRSVAAAAASISRQTIYNWVDVHPEFKELIELAEAHGEMIHVGRIQRGDQNWQSSAWFLERARAQRWAKRDYVEPEDDDEKDKVIDVDGFTVVIKAGSKPSDLAAAIPPNAENGRKKTH